jgi:hypothetical protein
MTEMQMSLRLLRERPSEFEIAKSCWAEVSERRRELKERLAGAEAALASIANPPQEHDHFSPVLAAKAVEYVGGRRPSAETLQTEIRHLREAVSEAVDGYAVERQAWRHALDAEAQRLAGALAPRHRAAVARIGKAIEALSAAVDAERSIRAELSELGSSILPDMGGQFGTLSEYGSAVSAWNRRALSLGLLQ